MAVWCGPVLPFRRLGSSRSLYPLARHYERNPGYPKPGRLNLLRRSALITPNRWCRNILPYCPSLTPFGLSLGTTNPGRINLPQETLDFRRARFARAFSLLIPALSLPLRPVVLTVYLQPNVECSPTTHADESAQIRSFGYTFSPDHCRRGLAIDR